MTKPWNGPECSSLWDNVLLNNGGVQPLFLRPVNRSSVLWVRLDIRSIKFTLKGHLSVMNTLLKINCNTVNVQMESIVNFRWPGLGLKACIMEAWMEKSGLAGRINDEHSLYKQTSKQEKPAGDHPKPPERTEDYIRRPLVILERERRQVRRESRWPCLSSFPRQWTRSHSSLAGLVPAPGGPINAAKSSMALLYQLGGASALSSSHALLSRQAWSRGWEEAL